MLSFIEILRPANCFMAAVAVYIGALVAGSGYVPGALLLYAMASALLICGAGMVINDFFDTAIDRVNVPERPIPSGRMKRNVALVYSVMLFAAGVALGYMINIYTTAIALFASSILVFYAWKLKKLPVLGNLFVSMLVALTFIYGGFVHGNYVPTLILAPLAFLANTGREVYKEITDVLGDRQHGAETVAVKYGVIKAKMVAAICVIFAIILSFLPFFLNMFGFVYLFFVVVADMMFMAAIIVPTKLAPKVCKFAMLVALLAFLAGGM